MEIRAPFVIVGSFVLAVILGVFGFVYWLNNAGAVGRRANYNIAFDEPVPGLLTGAAVLFNGIRVGEVTSLRLDAAHPEGAAATVAVGIDTPVRKDTKLGLDFQGLTGVPVVTLQGGSGTALRPGDVLQAEPGAGQSMTQAARTALGRIDTILAQNAEPLRNTISGLQVFADGLARNMPRVDNILAGLDRTMGGGQPPAAKSTFDLEAPGFSPGQPPLKAQITIGEPSAVTKLQTQRFLFPPGDDEPGFANAQWSDTLPALLQAKLLQSFENYDINHPPLRADGQQQGGTRLVLDLRKFEIERSPDVSAVIVMSAKVVDDSGKAVAGRILTASQPVTVLEPAAVAANFNQAFQSLARDLVQWTAQQL